MSEQTIRSASVTGTFNALGTDAAEARGGKVEPANGKELPVQAAASKPDLKKIAQLLNMAPRSIGRNLRFEVDLDSGKSVIQVLDRDTGELIRQIPPEKISTYLQSEGELAIRLYDEIV